MKKTREFYDNESEIISSESELLCRSGTIYNVQYIFMSLSPHRGFGAYSAAALIRVNTVFLLVHFHTAQAELMPEPSSHTHHTSTVLNSIHVSVAGEV